MGKNKKNVRAADVIRARRLALNTREGYKSLFFRIIVLGLTAYLIFTQVFLITQNSGLGMFPAVKDGDLLIAFRLQKDYAKEDVIVATVDGKQEVARIIARETDVVTLDESGKLLVKWYSTIGRDHVSNLRQRRFGIPLSGAGRSCVRSGRLPNQCNRQPGFRTDSNEAGGGKGDHHSPQKRSLKDQARQTMNNLPKGS